MAKTIRHYEKSKIYRPRRSGSIFSTNIITDNVTEKDGKVHNISDDNAVYARKWVDENHL